MVKEGPAAEFNMRSRAIYSAGDFASVDPGVVWTAENCRECFLYVRVVIIYTAGHPWDTHEPPRPARDVFLCPKHIQISVDFELPIQENRDIFSQMLNSLAGPSLRGGSLIRNTPDPRISTPW